MAATSQCPICGSALSPSAPEGLCPKCLWASLADGQVEDAAGESEFPIPSPALPGGILERVGDYELLGEIARGGMGVVYRARQISLQRVVALKMILAVHLPGEAEAKRFRAEAEAIASLEHPNIVPVHEVGEYDGRPYFTMKFVAGGSLADSLARSRRKDPAPSSAVEGEESADATLLAPEGAAALIAKIARAVHYAHQHGVLHRDLKPSNILLDANGEPLVTDFGLAKNIECDGDLTLSGAVLGTPAYIAPEQAAGGRSLTTAADVYSLGAIFYELLAGQPPFRAGTHLETLRLVVDHEPAPPSSIDPKIDRSLQAICLACLEKDPARRYRSAEALAEDLERWQRHEPILARPSSTAERLRKWVRRRPAAAALAAVAILAPAIIIAVLLAAGGRVREERNRAVENEGKATKAAREAVAARVSIRQNLYAADMLLAQQALDDGNFNLARRLVESYRPQHLNRGGSNDSDTVDLRGYEWRHLWARCQGDPRVTLYGHDNPVYSVAVSPDSKQIASGDSRGQIKLWEAGSHRASQTWSASDSPIARLVFSRNGRILASGDQNGLVKVWNLDTGKTVWQHQGKNIEGVQFSPVTNWIGVTDGEMGASTPSQAARVIDWTTGEEIFRVNSADFEDFSPDGKLIFVTRRKEVGTQIWDLGTRRIIKTLPQFSGCLAVSPDGRFFATAVVGKGIYLAHLADAGPPSLLATKAPRSSSFAFSPDGTKIAIACPDQVVRLGDIAECRETGRLLGHVGGVTGVAFSPDGKFLATSSLDHTVQLWPDNWKEQAPELCFSNTYPPYIISPDGTKLAGIEAADITAPSRLRVWDLTALKSVFVQPGSMELTPDFFSADSQTFFARGAIGTNGVLPLLNWDLSRPGSPAKIVPLALAGTNVVLGSAATPDGLIYAVTQKNAPSISFWNPRTGEPIGQIYRRPDLYLGAPYRFSPDGKKLAAYSLWNDIRLLDLSQPQKILAIHFDGVGISGSAFSPSGDILAVAYGDACIHLLDTSNLKDVAVLRGHQQGVSHVAFSPDGRTLASCGFGGVVKLWCWPARREVATLAQGNHDFCFLAFNPDGNSLVAAGWGGFQIFRVPSFAETDREP